MKTLDLPEIPKASSGKVREMFDLGEHLLMVATDRISAFDVILPDIVPHKGKILNQISAFWFSRTTNIIRNHMLTIEPEDYPSKLKPFAAELAGRSMVVHKCRPLPVECVVRGYIAGSGWKDYQQTGSVCGIPLPAGLEQAQCLDEPIFTPATKAASGHDENIPFSRAVNLLGKELAERVRQVSLDLYSWARDYARSRGIIICDTKFEFGLIADDLLLIDEVLTPDSSRFWPSSRYRTGSSPPSFDKQFIRDHLETLDWDKTAPGPRLPIPILEASGERYVEAFRVLTGQEPVL